MQKIQVFLREDQKAALKAISARSGVRQSDLIRRSIDKFIDEASREEADWREATRAAFGMWRDREDIDELMSHMRERTKARFPHLYGQK